MKVGIMGAGAIGCYLGGRLLEVGFPTLFVGRPSLAAELTQHGMRLSDYRGKESQLAAERLTVATDASALADCDVVLVTVKSGGTVEAGASLASILRPEACVVSLQNGVNNAELLRAALPRQKVFAGMVPFNVLRRDGGRFHQGTSGRLALQRAAETAPLVDAFRRAGLPVLAHDDMQGVLWGKLLLNLNNSVNALSGIPIREMLEFRDYRLIMAASVREALPLLARAKIRPQLEVKLPPRWMPWILSLPNALFSLVARPMVRVDPQARSSMWDDLERGRKTEVDVLNGEVVRLAERLSARAPVNAAIVTLIKEYEGRRSPKLAAAELRARLGV